MNATCDACNTEMTKKSKGCLPYATDSKGKKFKRIPYGSESGWDASEPCHDCNVVKGKIHHAGCDVEDCPKCGGQMLSCDCDWKSISNK